ncbi:MAG: hypothetical protein J6J42_05370 [Lachnospiraceae bacterium]|nr:hypothetical protein [Lachnospiraceae bacterium]MBP3609749.1 hypothetical protein [Lachnospiraceae bacterium]
MFGFFKNVKATKELDRIIAEINMNMQNNYKDAAQEGLREFEMRLEQLAGTGELSAAQKSEYTARLSSYKEKMKSYSHKDQKPYWTKE